MRIKQYFSQCSQKKGNIIPYIVAGDPDMKTTLQAMHMFADKGVGMIEIGIPFSDPFAEGKNIQAAHARALEKHVDVAFILKLCASFRETNNTTAIILMGYSNSIAYFGYEKFAQAAKINGVDGLLLVDMPSDCIDKKLSQVLQDNNIDFINLIAPTTPIERITLLASQASGFIYYIAVKGVTGSSALDISSVQEKMTILKQISSIPVVVGFGIKTRSDVNALKGVADSVVIGSEIVHRLHVSGLQGLSDYIDQLI